MTWLLPLVVLFPLIAAAFATHRGAWWTPAVAAVPALASVFLVPIGEPLDLSWLLLGTRFGLDEVGRIFLIFTSILWIAAGIYAVANRQGTLHPGRFNTFFLLAMAGNLWLIVGLDVVSFYVGFALMGISAYGLVVHDGNRDALRAGKVYLVLTLGAEVALFVALVKIASTTGSLHPSPEDLVELTDLTIGLLVLGFAVKAGLLPLHVWLPLAHPAAPIPASAVLSGAMIKVALLGWLRFLPLGEIALPGWGLLFVFVGLTTALYAAPIGLVQSNPKVLLAYSSVGKMGLMVVALGLMLIEPEIAPLAAVGIALYAGHHALAKGALFLGVGLRKSADARRLVFGGLVVLALSMAAVPLTSGAVAKYGIKPVLGAVDWEWLPAAVALTTIATTWLMARFLWLMWRLEPVVGAKADIHPQGGRIDRALWGWLPLILLVLLYPLVLGSPAAWMTDSGLMAATLLITLPVLIAALRRPAALAPVVDMVRPGDLLGLVRPVLIAARWSLRLSIRAGGRAGASVLNRAVGQMADLARRPPSDLDRRLTAWPLAGGLWLAITIGLIALTMLAAIDSTGTPRGDRDEIPSEIMARPVADPASRPGPPEPVAAAPRPTPEPAAEPEVSTEPPIESASAPRATDDIPIATDATTIDQVDPAATPAGPSEQAARVCDPTRPYLFGHSPSGREVALTRCVEIDGAPRLLDAPELSNALVLVIQAHLNALGFDAGPTDGIIGPATRGAIRRFRIDRGLAPTGTIDFDLLEQLQPGNGLR